MVLSELRQQPHLVRIVHREICRLLIAYTNSDVSIGCLWNSNQRPWIFGTCIHRVLEQFYSARMIGEKMLLKDVHQIFETTWTGIAADRDDIRYNGDNDFKSLLMYGKDLLTAWYNKLPDDGFTILAIEEAFSFTLPGIPIPIIGAMDLVEEDSAGTIIITDFKTIWPGLFAKMKWTKTSS